MGFFGGGMWDIFGIYCSDNVRFVYKRIRYFFWFMGFGLRFGDWVSNCDILL